MLCSRTPSWKIHDIAPTDKLPGKFLELILLELKHAGIVEIVRGAKSGDLLKFRTSSNT
jgi:DNA-binding IscR family transcriptional regulator